MSDTSQGPGWWLASDGKWYPPQTAAPSPVPPPPPPRRRSPSPPPLPMPITVVHAGTAAGPGTPGLRARDGRAGIGIERGHERPRHRRPRARHPLAVRDRLGPRDRVRLRRPQPDQTQRTGGVVAWRSPASCSASSASSRRSSPLIAVRAGVEEIVDNQPDEFDDVEILDCAAAGRARRRRARDHERQLEAVQLLHHRRVPGGRERRRPRLHARPRDRGRAG